MKCPQCPTGQMFEDEDEKSVFVCINCGYRKMSNWARARFFDNNQKEIIADFKLGGIKLLESKWRIKFPTWYGLKKRWALAAGPVKAEKKQVIEVPVGKVIRITIEVL